VGLTAHYLDYSSSTVAYGGTTIGLLYGVAGSLIIGMLMYLGIRKRTYTSGVGTLQGWVSAHVYLGLLTLVLIPMHAGFRFGWDVHTLAFVLLAIVVLSGVLGTVLYLTLPARLTKHEAGLQADKIDKEIGRLLSDIRSLVKDKSDAMVRLYHNEVAALQTRKPSGWSLLWRGLGGDVISKRAAELAQAVSAIPAEEQAAFRLLSQLLLKKAQLEVTLLHQMRIRNALQAWLYVHVPVSIAMIVTLTIHVIVVFYY
jgi:hypothetical protein